MAEEKETTCSLCEGELDTTGYPLWCKKCRTERKRALKQAHEAMANGKGFVAGAEAMRQSLIAKVRGMHPTAHTNFGEIARWLSEFPTPRP